MSNIVGIDAFDGSLLMATVMAIKSLPKDNAHHDRPPGWAGLTGHVSRIELDR